MQQGYSYGEIERQIDKIRKMDFKEFFQISMETFKHNPKIFHKNF